MTALAPQALIKKTQTLVGLVIFVRSILAPRVPSVSTFSGPEFADVRKEQRNDSKYLLQI